MSPGIDPGVLVDCLRPPLVTKCALTPGAQVLLAGRPISSPASLVSEALEVETASCSSYSPNLDSQSPAPASDRGHLEAREQCLLTKYALPRQTPRCRNGRPVTQSRPHAGSRVASAIGSPTGSEPTLQMPPRTTCGDSQLSASHLPRALVPPF